MKLLVHHADLSTSLQVAGHHFITIRYEVLIVEFSFKEMQNFVFVAELHFEWKHIMEE
jgi:hypothetical protein